MQILKEEIREQIENAAIKVFLENGFTRASMQRVAEQAGISVSNIYNYFEGKEQLFEAIVAPVHRELHQLLQSFMKYETGQSFGDGGFIEGFIQFIAMEIGRLIKKNRQQLLLIFDKSYGTKYEQAKEELAGFLEAHFINSLGDKPSESVSFIMHISATNLVEGLLEILRHYRSDAWVERSIKDFIRYHIRGLAQFFE